MKALRRILMLGLVAGVTWAGPVAVHIEAQPLDKALNVWAGQTGYSVMVPIERAARGKMAPKVEGMLAPEEALRALLAGTGLQYEFVGEREVVIRAGGKTAGVDEPDTSSVMRVARNDSSSGRGGTGERANSSASKGGDPEGAGIPGSNPSALDRGEDDEGGLEEVLVTGTHIRGSQTASPVLTFTRLDFERAGSATAQQFLSQLPQNFGGGAGEGTLRSIDADAGLNIGYGSGVNLRGLGNDSTLVLVNGRRIAAGGSGANFVDISTIPLVAIDRIDVLTDGASALYGSDAIGGVVNLIMRSDFDGAESRVRYGLADSGVATERQIGQVLGKDWGTGNALFTYEYYQRDNLAAQDRSFAADSDLRRFGGGNFSTEASNPGNVTDFVQNFAIPAGQNGENLTAADLLENAVNLQNQWLDTDLLPKQEQQSAFVTLSQSVSDVTRVFADARFGRRKFQNRTTATSTLLAVPSTNPFFVDPFGGSDVVFVNYSFAKDLGPVVSSGDVTSYGGTIGAAFHLLASWGIEIFGSHSVEKTENNQRNHVDPVALDIALADIDPTTAFNPFGDGSHTNPVTLERIQGFVESNTGSKVSMFHAKADGQLFSIPGGDIMLALGAEYRKETFSGRFATFGATNPSVPEEFPGGNRDVTAGFAELRVPLISPLNRRAGLSRLEFSVAGRIERYEDFGSTADPSAGLLWSPIDGVVLRSTVGTSFKAPLLSELQGTKLITQRRLRDAVSPTGFTNTLIITGLKDDLQPEEATTWTAGIELRPSLFGNLGIEMTYFNIEVEDRITSPVTNVVAVLANPQIFSSVLTRNPGVEIVTALFNDPDFLGVMIPPNQVGAIIDSRIQNIAVSNLRGIDLNATYNLRRGHSTVDLYVSGSYLLDLEQGVTPTAPLLDQVNTLGNPADLKLRGGLSWSWRGVVGSVFINYVDNYIDIRSNPNQPRPIDSWITTDSHFSYSTGERSSSGVFSDLTVSCSINNLFDEEAPFSNAFGYGFDAINSNPLGRFISLQLVKTW